MNLGLLEKKCAPHKDSRKWICRFVVFVVTEQGLLSQLENKLLRQLENKLLRRLEDKVSRPPKDEVQKKRFRKRKRFRSLEEELLRRRENAARKLRDKHLRRTEDEAKKLRDLEEKLLRQPEAEAKRLRDLEEKFLRQPQDKEGCDSEDERLSSEGNYDDHDGESETNDGESETNSTDGPKSVELRPDYSHLWSYCDNCINLNYRPLFSSKLFICEYCDSHLEMNSVERIEFVIDGNTWNPSDEDLVSEDQILVPASFTNSIDLPIDISEEAIIIMMEPGPPFDVTKGLVLPDRWRMTGVPKVFIGDDDEEEAEALPEGEGLGSGPPSSTNLGAGALDPDESDSNSFSSYFSIVILVITKELAEKSRMNTVPKVFIGDFDEAEAESLRGLGGGDQGGGPSISTNLGAGALDPDESDSNSSSSNEEESYEEPDESDSNSSSSNEEEFYEEESYEEHVDSYQTNTGLTEAVQTGLGRINDIPVAIAVMDFQFIGGSMGSLVGDKITRLIEYATNQSLPLIIVCASGGARMQEGSLSLIQMAKISSALYDFQSKEKLFYVPILTSPTTGGVTASFGMLGDIIIAEPNAYIAFAGKRVIEELLKVIVPEGSQETENLFEKGLFDLIVPRTLFKTVINELLQFHGFFPLKSN